MSDLLRERFEAWWWPNGVPKYVRYDNGTYHGWNSNSVTAANFAWRGWQAALAAAAPPPDLRVDANGNECSADPCADHGSHYSIPAPPPDRNDLLGGQGGRGPEAPATQRQSEVAGQKETPTVECDCCGQRFPRDEVSFIPAESSGAAQCDTTACESCRGLS